MSTCRLSAYRARVACQRQINELGVIDDQFENEVMNGRMMNALSAPYREAITLTKIIGLSTAETASHLSISESTVKVRVHRATSKLRRMMEADTL